MILIGFIIVFASCSNCDSLVGIVDSEIHGDSRTNVQVIDDSSFQYFVIEAGMETFHDGQDTTQKFYRNGIDLKMTAFEFENEETGERKWFRREYGSFSPWRCMNDEIEFLPYEDVEILTPLTFGKCYHVGQYQSNTCAWKIGIKFPSKGRITRWADIESIADPACGSLSNSDNIFDIKIYGSDENYNILYYTDLEEELQKANDLIDELDLQVTELETELTNLLVEHCSLFEDSEYCGDCEAGYYPDEVDGTCSTCQSGIDKYVFICEKIEQLKDQIHLAEMLIHLSDGLEGDSTQDANMLLLAVSTKTLEEKTKEALSFKPYLQQYCDV